jgi:putative ABC transport system permease protein
MEPTPFDVLRQDIRFGLRQLVRNPVFTMVALLTLALGIGANTAIFSVVDGILFRPLPFPDSHELVSVWTDASARGEPADEWLSYANVHDLGEQTEGLEALAAWGGWRGTLTGEGEAEQLSGAAVGHDMFSHVLKVEPALGRDFEPRDDHPGAERALILSHGLWQRAFGGDPTVIGRTLQISGESWEVIGVMPSSFLPPFVPDAELWGPLRMDMSEESPRRGAYYLRAMGRRTDGTSMPELDAELRVVGARLEKSYPESNIEMTFDAIELREDVVSEARTGLLVLLAAVGFVLLVACVNVANLLLARASARRAELGVRSALGAPRGRIVRQILTEAGLLAVAGGAVGVLVATWGTELLTAMAPEGTPRIDEVGLDGRVLAVTALVTIAAGGIFGLVPAIRAGGEDAASALREGGRGRSAGLATTRARSLLVVGQVALALVLLIGAGLLVQSFRNLRATELGFQPANVLVMEVSLSGEQYETGDQRRAFYDALEERLSALPGVESVGLTSTVPLTGFDSDVSFNIEGEPIPEAGQPQATWFRRVTPSYFSTIGIRIISGRSFQRADDGSAPPVVIVNETFVRRYFAGREAVGQRINIGGTSDPVWREIVGVAADIRNFGVREDSRVALYSPYAQTTAGYVSPVLKTSVPPETVVPAVRSAIYELDGTLAAGQITTMDELVLSTIAPDRFVATLLSLFAVIALLLAAVGLYGVVSFNVARRLPEMGVRMALGAASRDVGGLVLRQSMALVAAGVVLGAGAAAFLTRLIDGLLYGVPALDPLTYAVVSAVLLLAGGAAAAVPAIRAARLDPVRVLSTD